MTSILASHFAGRSLPTAAGFIPASFENSAGYSQAFPWRYNKATQAIDLEFVDGFNNTTSINSDTLFFRGQQFGSLRLVQQLGPNFINWCENTSEINAQQGTVELYENPIVVNANMVAPRQDPNRGETQEETFPISFETAAGSVEGKYYKTVIFMKPMVITYIREGTRYYRWFNQNFEGNS